MISADGFARLHITERLCSARLWLAPGCATFLLVTVFAYAKTAPPLRGRKNVINARNVMGNLKMAFIYKGSCAVLAHEKTIKL
jgi:hypothetical protein